MWTRKQLKERAKASFYRNRWRTVLVSLITVLYLGVVGYCGTAVISRNADAVWQETAEDLSESYGEPKKDGKPEPDLYGGQDSGSGMNDAPEMGDGFEADDSEAGGGIGANSYHSDRDFDRSGYDENGIMDVESYALAQGVTSHEYSPSYAMTFSVVIILLTILGMLIVAALVLAVVALIVNPLLVGCRRFFFINLNTPARVGELGYGFDTNYRNITRIMLDKTIYTILWSLLFFVPGLVKNYEYMMVPYILAEEPDIDRKRAFAISKEMMQGNKWKAFLLDVSFVPWHMLSSITVGIVGIFYVTPYKNMTYAAFYEQMRSNYTQKRMACAQPGQPMQSEGAKQNSEQPESAEQNSRQPECAEQKPEQSRQPECTEYNTKQLHTQDTDNRQRGGIPQEGMGD